MDVDSAHVSERPRTEICSAVLRNYPIKEIKF